MLSRAETDLRCFCFLDPSICAISYISLQVEGLRESEGSSTFAKLSIGVGVRHPLGFETIPQKTPSFGTVHGLSTISYEEELILTFKYDGCRAMTYYEEKWGTRLGHECLRTPMAVPILVQQSEDVFTLGFQLRTMVY